MTVEQFLAAKKVFEVLEPLRLKIDNLDFMLRTKPQAVKVKIAVAEFRCECEFIGDELTETILFLRKKMEKRLNRLEQRLAEM